MEFLIDLGSMSFQTLNAAPTSTAPSPRAGVQLAHELTALVDEIQRTRDWFNTQIEAQLSSLRHLKATMQVEEPMCRASVSTLFEAPHPVVAAETLPRFHQWRCCQPLRHFLPRLLCLRSAASPRFIRPSFCRPQR